MSQRILMSSVIITHTGYHILARLFLFRLLVIRHVVIFPLLILLITFLNVSLFLPIKPAVINPLLLLVTLLVDLKFGKM